MEIFVWILLGFEFGSFANVCIYRWPRDLSIVKPHRSFCPWCEVQIPWWQNIPLISYITLKGKCSQCHSPISVRYPLIEIIFPLLLLIINLSLPTKPDWPAVVLVFIFVFVLIVTTATDLDWRIIPDQAVLLLLMASLLAAPWNPWLNSLDMMDAYEQSVLGGLIGGGILWMIALVGEWIFGKEAMGMGDVKLLAALGTLLGPTGAMSILLLAATLGGGIALIGIALKILKRHQYVPFGPFLNIAAFIEFLFQCRQNNFPSWITTFLRQMTF